MAETRSIEMYVGIYEGNLQTWFTDFIDIPTNTPEDKLDEVAEAAMTKRLEEQKPPLSVAFVGVFCINDEEEEDGAELLVTIDKRDPETEGQRIREVEKILGTEASSVDDLRNGIDILFDFDTAGEAEEAERKLAAAKPPFVSSIMVPPAL